MAFADRSRLGHLALDDLTLFFIPHEELHTCCLSMAHPGVKVAVFAKYINALSGSELALLDCAGRGVDSGRALLKLSWEGGHSAGAEAWAKAYRNS